MAMRTGNTPLVNLAKCTLHITCNKMDQTIRIT